MGRGRVDGYKSQLTPFALPGAACAARCASCLVLNNKSEEPFHVCTNLALIPGTNQPQSGPALRAPRLSALCPVLGSSTCISPASGGRGKRETAAMAATPPASAGHPYPLPKMLTHPSSTPPQLITQGAEGRLYRTTYLLPDLPCALKHRPPKPYRHPVLDARLTRQRILAEARILQRCRRNGVRVPAVYAVDESTGCMMMEWIEGQPVRARLVAWLGQRTGADPAAVESDPELLGLLGRVGSAVGEIHRLGIVHGDLTTSNMMLRPWAEGVAGGHTEERGLLDGEVVVIDFGLASQSVADEDRAVDLYVLERAFASTHPRAEHLFDEVLQAYKTTFKQGGPVLKRLEDVRMRGRKRSMLG